MALTQNTHKQHGVYEETHLHNQSFLTQSCHNHYVRFDKVSLRCSCSLSIVLKKWFTQITIQINNSPHCYIPKLFKFLSSMQHKRPFSPEFALVALFNGITTWELRILKWKYAKLVHVTHMTYIPSLLKPFTECKKQTEILTFAVLSWVFYS